MPPRTPLGVISGNRRKSKDLTPFQRGKIVGNADTGLSIALIAENYNIAESTVRSTLQLNPQRHLGESKPRSGRPKFADRLIIRNILRVVRVNPKITYDKLRTEIQQRYSNSTLRRILQNAGITNWRAKKRPLLRSDVVKKRL